MPNTAPLPPHAHTPDRKLERQARREIRYKLEPAADVLIRRAEALERAARRNGRDGKFNGRDSKNARASVLRTAAAIIGQLHTAPLDEVLRLWAIPAVPASPPPSSLIAA